MPILNPVKKTKRIILIMANTPFRALSGVRPVNWGVLIHEVVSRAIPYIGRKPSYLSPFILHLYQHYECATIDEKNLLTIAAGEVAYKLHPVVANTSTSNDPIIPEAPPSSAGSPPPSFRRPNCPTPPLPHHHPEAVGPSRIRLGETWIFPPGIFLKIPSNGFTTTWRISITNTTDWKTSPGEPTRHWMTADPETYSESWRTRRTGKNSTRRRRSSSG